MCIRDRFDPHSSYLSPRSVEDFDVNMSLKLNGIGALLGTEDDYTKIISLVPGGPAQKSGKINPEDRITKIRQIGSNEYKDVVGWRIDEVVDLIRGEAGSEVEIEFISFNSDDDSTKLITLKREEIKLEDRAAKSKIIDIVTTINIDIQDVTENALKKALKFHDADWGTVVVMEVNTGNVKAIANLKNNDGTFDEYYNHAIAEHSEPGSTFKLASIIAGLEDGYYSLLDSVDTEDGTHKFYNEIMRDSKKGGYGKITIGEAFVQSSNVGFWKISNKFYINKNTKEAFLFKDNKKIKLRSSKEKNFKKIKLSGNFHGHFSLDKLKKVKKILPMMQFPCMDALSYSHFCEGKIDVVFQCGNKIWDIFPLIPIIRASGGIVTNWKNQFNFKSGNVLVSPNKILHSKMLKMLRPLN